MTTPPTNPFGPYAVGGFIQSLYFDLRAFAERFDMWSSLDALYEEASRPREESEAERHAFGAADAAYEDAWGRELAKHEEAK